jgi:hypothetical protein
MLQTWVAGYCVAYTHLNTRIHWFITTWYKQYQFQIVVFRDQIGTYYTWVWISKKILASNTNITPHTNNEIATWNWNCQNFLNINCLSLVSKFSEVLYNKTNLVCTKYDFPVILWLHCFQPRGNDRAQPSWDFPNGLLWNFFTH